MSTVAYYYLNIQDARGEHKQMTERELQIARKHEIEYAKLQEQKREPQNTKEPQSPGGANDRKDPEKETEQKEKESEHAKLHDQKCETNNAKKSQSSDGAYKRKEGKSNQEPPETKDIARKKPAVRDKEYGPALRFKEDALFELTFIELKC